jgi:hypothetical protein
MVISCKMREDIIVTGIHVRGNASIMEETEVAPSRVLSNWTHVVKHLEYTHQPPRMSIGQIQLTKPEQDRLTSPQPNP